MLIGLQAALSVYDPIHFISLHIPQCAGRDSNPTARSECRTIDDGVPGEPDIGDVRSQRQAGGAPALLPEVERLREAAHRPDRVVRAVIQLWRSGAERSPEGAAKTAEIRRG